LGYTIKDIAKESGYAVSTVSRALNDHPDVSEEAKRRIREIVEAHNFIPNSNARQLKAQQSKDIAVIIKGTFNLFFASILEQMQSLITMHGYTADVHYLDEDADEVFAGEQLARESKPLGIVFLGGNAYTFKESFQQISLPCVLATTVSDQLNFKNLSCVGVDDTAAFYQAASSMIQRGHKKFAILGGDRQLSYISELRFEGALHAFHEVGIAFPSPSYQKANFTFGSGYRSTQRLLARTKDFTCLLCMSDAQAIGAIRALHEAGIRVPEDVSVVGFDGIELGDYCIPKLATIRQPQSEIARSSILQLLAQMEKGEEARHIHLNAVMVEGESVRSVSVSGSGN